MDRRPLALVALAAVLAVPACGGGGRQQGRQDARTLASERFKTTSEFQKPMLADGVVTFAEYERATLAEIDCIKAALPSVKVDGPRATQSDHPTLEYTLEVIGDVPAADEAQFEKAQAECHTRYLSDVGAVWATQDIPSEEERKTLLGDLRDCLVGAGVDLPAKAGLDDVADALDTPGSTSGGVAACMEKYGSVLVAPPS